MTYPMDGLAIIAPILFIVMIIGFPLIGLAVGWKRALYWGGGNFLFYIIGLIIWKTAGGAIGVKIAELLKQAIEQLQEMDPSKLATSVAAPVFFIVVLLIGNLLLLINYYAWFKKVAKIKADIAARKALKAMKKQYKEKGKKMPKVLTATTKDGVKVTEKVYGVRVGNRVIGLTAMGLLMVPVAASLTNAVFYLTSTSTTRATNKFAEGLYESLNRTDANVSWFSYYGGTAGDDINALLTTVNVIDEKGDIIVVETFVDQETGEVSLVPTVQSDVKIVEYTMSEVPKTITDMSKDLTNFTPDNVQSTYKKAAEEATKAGETEPEKIKAAATKAVNKDLQLYAASINKLASQWNSLVTLIPEEIVALVSSNGTLDLIKQIIPTLNNESVATITNDLLDKVFGKKDSQGKRTDGIYFQIRDSYLKAIEDEEEKANIKVSFDVDGTKYTFNFSILTLQTLAVKLSAIKNVKSVVYSLINFANDVTDQDKTFFDERVDELIGLLLTKK